MELREYTSIVLSLLLLLDMLISQRRTIVLKGVEKVYYMPMPMIFRDSESCHLRSKDDIYHTELLKISLLQAGITLVGITPPLARKSETLSTVNLKTLSASLTLGSKGALGDMITKMV